MNFIDQLNKEKYRGSAKLDWLDAIEILSFARTPYLDLDPKQSIQHDIYINSIKTTLETIKSYLKALFEINDFNEPIQRQRMKRLEFRKNRLEEINNFLMLQLKHNIIQYQAFQYNSTVACEVLMKYLKTSMEVWEEIVKHFELTFTNKFSTETYDPHYKSLESWVENFGEFLTENTTQSGKNNKTKNNKR
jgi:hypothetical protein